MNDTNPISGAKALMLSLMDLDVDTIFGYPGGTVMPIYDQIYDHLDNLNHILVRHEQGAVHAAEGYARATGKPGVCIATAGPGATNFVTGIADAMMDSTPLVCITAQVNADKLGSAFFQEADIIGITLPITKWSYQITSASEIPHILPKAFKIATEGRPGPVVISIAKNAQVEQVVYNSQVVKNSTKPQLSPSTKNQLRIAAELLNSAQRPLIIAGHGVTISRAEGYLKSVIDKGFFPLATTILGLSAIESTHPLYYGNIGMHGHLAPNRLTQLADVILAVGMRFSDRGTGETKGYAPNAKIIHIDIDPAEINKNIKTDLAITADAALALEVLDKQITNKSFKDRKEWIECANKFVNQEKENFFNDELSLSGDKIKMAQVISSVCKKCDYNQLLVTDVGQNQMFAARYAKFAQPRSWITSGGLGTMGFGLPAAIGAKIGVPDREVVMICGDGGFQMNIQELGTILQSKINVKIVIMNNSFLGMVRQWQELFFDKRYAFTHLANPDFMELAKAYSIKGDRIDSPSQIEDAVAKMVEWNGPYLLEVVVENEENVFPMIPAGATLDQIIDKKPE